MEDPKGSLKRVRDDDDINDPPEVKRLRENLLDEDEDDDDVATDLGQDLDSFMKSFEDEISPAAAPDAADGGGGGDDHLGYLFGASDDDLGLPQAQAQAQIDENNDDRSKEDEVVVVSGLEESSWEVPNYDDDDTFGFGFGKTEVNEYVALDGLFDYSDVGAASTTDFGSWSPETLPAQL